jgi:hypothetical protein
VSGVCAVWPLALCVCACVSVSVHVYYILVILLYTCPHTAIYVPAYCYIRVLILLYTCPHTAIHVSSYCNMCPYTAIYVSSYREARKEGGIVTNKEAGKERKLATLTHMQNASRRTAMRAAMEAGAVRTLLVLPVQK